MEFSYKNYSKPAPVRVNKAVRATNVFGAGAIVLLQTSSIIPHNIEDWSMFGFGVLILFANTIEVFLSD